MQGRRLSRRSAVSGRNRRGRASYRKTTAIRSRFARPDRSTARSGPRSAQQLLHHAARLGEVELARVLLLERRHDLAHVLDAPCAHRGDHLLDGGLVVGLGPLLILKVLAEWYLLLF